jgi:hypothetical protein
MRISGIRGFPFISSFASCMVFSFMYLWVFVFVYAENVCDFHTKKSVFAYGEDSSDQLNPFPTCI